MQWIVAEHFKGERIFLYGPFPTQDQAMTYAEHQRARIRKDWNGPDFQFTVGQLHAPSFMPEVIHG